MSNRLSESFKNPGAAYRGKPFWAWNGKLEEGELRRQLRVFRQMGLGGAFMHARVGLATEYLSEEWFRLVGACADEARKNGLEAWLYDEDRWPSGAAGGLVTRNRKHRHRNLNLEVVEEGEAARGKGAYARFAAVFASDWELASYRRLRAGEKAGAGEKTLVFRIVEDEPSPWYNGQTYLDTLSKDAVAQFIKVTHETYRKHNGKDFGKTIPGIFMDEPNYGRTFYDSTARQGCVPWTDELPAFFRRRYGYALADVLPELFFLVAGERFSKARRDYRDCICHLFCVNFGKQIFDWCTRNGLASTGHVLNEQDLLYQTASIGSAMRFYEFMQAPGIDILTAQGVDGRPRWGRPEYVTAKQCASVLDQFGRRTMLSELYGCTGWDFTLAEEKINGDWQAALGVNLRCQHLSWYTMLGEAKRDYPASIFHQSPWWKDYALLEDHFARVNLLMTQGQAVRDVAVIHPVETVWGLYFHNHQNQQGIESARQDCDTPFLDLVDWLLQEHWDFDFVDEDLLARHGGAGRGELRMGKGRYRVVIVPPMVTIRSSTLKFLEKVVRSGGTVIYAGQTPTHRDAVKMADGSAGVVAGARRVGLDRAEIVQALAAVPGLRRIRVQSADGGEYRKCLYMMRQDPKTGRTLVFVCHTSDTQPSGPLTVTLSGQGQAQEWDTRTGEVFRADAVRRGDAVEIRTDLPPYGSHLFVLDPKGAAPARPRSTTKVVRTLAVQADAFPILRDEPNAVPLDRPEFSIAGGPWQPPLEILKLDRKVRDAIGLPWRGGEMVQPWARKQETAARKTAGVSLRYAFEVEQLPSGPCHLVLEEPAKFRVALNGHALDTADDDGWWIDQAMRKLVVNPAWLKPGRNELLLETKYDADSGLEAVFLAGEFGVRWNGTVAVVGPVPTTLRPGNWVSQGLACYSGAITYLCEAEIEPAAGERVVLDVPDWKGNLLRIHVNGRPAAKIAWPPYACDITEWVQPGLNRIGIEVVSSRKNLLGPLHKPVASFWIGPGEFLSEGQEWTDAYVSVPYGLMAPPRLSIREGAGRSRCAPAASFPGGKA